MTQKIIVGRISTAFGIKGEIKLISFCDEPQKIEQYPLFNKDGKEIKLTISNKNKAVVGSAEGGAILIAKIHGVENRTDAEKLRGEELFVERKNFSELNEDEFYYVDLIGLEVLDVNDKKIGKVINVYDHGAGGSIEIEFTQSDSKNNREKIESFPFKNAIFPEVNLKKGYIKIEMPEIV